MQTPYQRKSVTIAAGSVAAPKAYQILGAVRFLMLVGATAPTSVAVRFGSTAKGVQGTAYMLLQYGKIGPLPDGVDAFEILNTSGAPNTVDVVWGVSDFNYAPPTTTSVATLADGADVAMGAKADAAATTDAGTFSLIALVKRIAAKFSPHPKGLRVAGQTAAMVATASTAVIAAPGAGKHLVIDTVLLYNSHATVDTEVAILNGAAEVFRVNLRAALATAPNQPVVVTLPKGIQLASDTALNAQNITTGSSTRAAAFGVVEDD